MRHPALDGLLAEPRLDPSRPDRLVYRGRRGGCTVEVAIAPDGVAEVRVRASTDQTMRFVTRAQCPTPAFDTGDVAFDAELAVLGDENGLLTLDATTRQRIRAWLAQPGRWCTDAEAGARGVASDRVGAVVDAGVALLDGLEAPDLPTLIRERHTWSPARQAHIDARVRREIADAPRLDAILDAMTAAPSAVRTPWLVAALDRLTPHAARVLALLDEPSPPAFDALILAWNRHDPRLDGWLAGILADPARAQALLQTCAEDAIALRQLSGVLPKDAWTVGWFETLAPSNTQARVARLDALAARPAGDPLAYRRAMHDPGPSLRARASEVVAVHLAAWLSDPRLGPIALSQLGLADAHAMRFIEITRERGEPALVAALARHTFGTDSLEALRLDVLADADAVPPISLAPALASRTPRVRAAAERALDAHLEAWLAEPDGGRVIADALPAMPELGARVLALCGSGAYPGAVDLLRALNPRSESERVAVVEAHGRTRRPRAEDTLLAWMERGYRVRLACVEALGLVGGQRARRALEGVSTGFFVEKTLKETALRAIGRIEARLGGGSGALSIAEADGRLSLPGDD